MVMLYVVTCSTSSTPVGITPTDPIAATRLFCNKTQILFALTSLVRFVLIDAPSGVDSAVIRIILADSQVVYRVGILQLLTSEIDVRMVAQTNTLDGVRRAVEHYFIPSPMQRASTSAVILLANNWSRHRRCHSRVGPTCAAVEDYRPVG
jgi:hypothetical protein